MSPSRFRVPTALLGLLSVGNAEQCTPDGKCDSPKPLTYSPARPPSIPLAVRSPYTSAWSTTAGGGTLNSGSVQFWTGDALGWEGVVTVDGIAYQYMGNGFSSLPVSPTMVSANETTVTYDSQYSNFTFAAGPVEITASFFSPVTPADVCRSSIPLSYLTTSVRSLDNATHAIGFYSDVDAAWISRDGRSVSWKVRRSNGTGNGDILHSWLLGLENPSPFAEYADSAMWGNFSFSTTPMAAVNLTLQAGRNVDVRYGYLGKQTLDNTFDYRGRDTVFAYSHDMGNVTVAQVRYAIGTIQVPLIRYLYRGGVTSLAPWWLQCYGDMETMIDFHWDDFDDVQDSANEFETRLKTDVTAYFQSNNTSEPYGQGSPIFNSTNAYGYLDPNDFTGVPMPGVSESDSYYAIVALSARQVMQGYVYAVPPSTTSNAAASAPLVFQKEISSSGNVNTVDVLFPAIPFLLWANPLLLRWTLEPLLQNQEAGFYPNGYSMHDVGQNFPNATGHVDGYDEYMPVEESGNFILMALAYHRFAATDESATAWLAEHYALLRRHAQYLVQFSLLPAAQLSTDDFADRLVNQTNLALKGIVGLQAMAEISRLVAQVDPSSTAPQDAEHFNATAHAYMAAWTTLAIDPSGKHTVLAYQWRSSWGLLYNAFPDLLLGLGMVPESVYAMQCAFYPTVSQVFGVPLDNRHHYTKSDWMMWTAATCGWPTRPLLVNALAHWLNETTTGFPFGDLFEVIGTGASPTVPNTVTFKGRPVVGGHFALLAAHRAGVRAGRGNVM